LLCFYCNQQYFRRQFNGFNDTQVHFQRRTKTRGVSTHHTVEVEAGKRKTMLWIEWSDADAMDHKTGEVMFRLRDSYSNANVTEVHNMLALFANHPVSSRWHNKLIGVMEGGKMSQQLTQIVNFAVVYYRFFSIVAIKSKSFLRSLYDNDNEILIPEKVQTYFKMKENERADFEVREIIKFNFVVLATVLYLKAFGTGHCDSFANISERIHQAGITLTPCNRSNEMDNKADFVEWFNPLNDETVRKDQVVYPPTVIINVRDPSMVKVKVKLAYAQLVKAVKEMKLATLNGLKFFVKPAEGFYGAFSEVQSSFNDCAEAIVRIQNYTGLTAEDGSPLAACQVIVQPFFAELKAGEFRVFFHPSGRILSVILTLNTAHRQMVTELTINHSPHYIPISPDDIACAQVLKSLNSFVQSMWDDERYGQYLRYALDTPLFRMDVYYSFTANRWIINEFTTGLDTNLFVGNHFQVNIIDLASNFFFAHLMANNKSPFGLVDTENDLELSANEKNVYLQNVERKVGILTAAEEDAMSRSKAGSSAMEMDDVDNKECIKLLESAQIKLHNESIKTKSAVQHFYAYTETQSFAPKSSIEIVKPLTDSTFKSIQLKCLVLPSTHSNGASNSTVKLESYALKRLAKLNLLVCKQVKDGQCLFSSVLCAMRNAPVKFDLNSKMGINKKEVITTDSFRRHICKKMRHNLFITAVLLDLKDFTKSTKAELDQCLKDYESGNMYTAHLDCAGRPAGSDVECNNIANFMPRVIACFMEINIRIIANNRGSVSTEDDYDSWARPEVVVEETKKTKKKDDDDDDENVNDVANSEERIGEQRTMMQCANDFPTITIFKTLNHYDCTHITGSLHEAQT
jgi:hypothetical protein